MFSMPQAERSAILSKYKTKTPAPLNSQFTERRSKAEAVENYNKRKQKETAAYPSGKVIAYLSLAIDNRDVLILSFQIWSSTQLRVAMLGHQWYHFGTSFVYFSSRYDKCKYLYI